MRVIRTEFYFEPTQLGLPAAVEFPGLSAAWFREPPSDSATTPDSDMQAVTADHTPEFEGFQVDWTGNPSVIELFPVHTFLVQSLYRGTVLAPALDVYLLDYIFEQEIVIERSPPEALSLASLISHGTNISIGSYLGYTAAGGNIPLMFLTVPAGVIVMGAAIGVSDGLRRGLQTTIEKYFTQAKRNTRKAKAVGSQAGR